jgi:hypothetical protein
VFLVGVALALVVVALDGDDQGSADLPKSALEKRAERIEARLGKDTTNEHSLIAITNAWISAGNDRLFKLNTQYEPIPGRVVEDFQTGLRAWNRYLKQTGGKAGAEFAELVASTYFGLVEIGSRNLEELKADAAGAVRAERVAGEGRQPGAITHSDLAIYEYYNGEFAAGDKTMKALAVDLSYEIHSNPHARLLLGYRERAEKLARREKRAAEMLRESGEEQLPFRLKGYGTQGSINGGEGYEKVE